MTKKIALITGITGQDGAYLAEYLINLAKLSQQMLSGKDLANFVKASMERI